MMKKLFILLFLILFSNKVYADPFSSIKSVVILDTNIKNVEQILIDTVNLYSPTLTLLNSIPERHIYNVRYNWGVYTAVPTSNINININENKEKVGSGTIKQEGGFSCSFKTIDEKNVIATCRKISPPNAYIYNHYEKFFKELKVNNLQYVSLRQYKKLKNNKNK